MRLERISCWEAANAADPMTLAAGRLYEETLAADERIPWAWIERSLSNGAAPDPKGRNRHLLLAAPEGHTHDPSALAGYAYGSFIPGYGAYLCYMGVAEAARRRGVGSRLMGEFFRVASADAARSGQPLPFTVWESHRPGPDAPDAEWHLWNARMRLFDRVGGRWVEGVEFPSPNWEDDAAPPVLLQLFVKPIDESAAAFDDARLREVVGGLHVRVYRNEPGAEAYEATLGSCGPLRLRPADELCRRVGSARLAAACG